MWPSRCQQVQEVILAMKSKPGSVEIPSLTSIVPKKRPKALALCRYWVLFSPALQGVLHRKGQDTNPSGGSEDWGPLLHAGFDFVLVFEPLRLIYTTIWLWRRQERKTKERFAESGLHGYVLGSGECYL